MTIYVYRLENDQLVDKHTADDNAAYERWANENYNPNDFYYSYTKVED